MPDEQKRVWTIRELMRSAIEHLQRKGFEDARLNVELLLAHTLNLQRIQLYLNFDKPLTSEELSQFRRLLERRLSHEPVQYIVGSTSFMGMKFDVDPRVLIPRPETETLIEQAILICQNYKKDGPIRILEIGTGSGNIAVSLAKFIKKSSVIAIDVSSEALIVAGHNAHENGVESKIHFSCSDIFNKSENIFHERYDILVSNPPYIPKDELNLLQAEIRDFEPVEAVTDGGDGFRFFKRITQIIPDILEPGGSVILEVGFKQEEEVYKILKSVGLSGLEIRRDLQGIPRVISGVWIGSKNTTIGLN
jgi:release factor glutamine methyltransferase